MKKSKW